jgi:hypothetical protein
MVDAKCGLYIPIADNTLGNLSFGNSMAKGEGEVRGSFLTPVSVRARYI